MRIFTRLVALGPLAWVLAGPVAALEAFRDVPPAAGLVYNAGFEFTGGTATPLG
ncbi:hypothetical protein [Hymenobacter sp. PAMC 26628]|uniref:hypothetical protein n=1 Tax=Hymenobacter sp. PAMC 26628 TaxID=1484118 RepID=UPI000AA196BA|nr:hypothetical protein [Hymenobacter sp. PAMC 26628]